MKVIAGFADAVFCSGVVIKKELFCKYTVMNTRFGNLRVNFCPFVGHL